MRRALLAALALSAATAAIAPARASDVAIAMDEVRTITFPQAVATVYVGNPAIADINMIDPRHAFLLGKGYGSTNMVAVTHDGTQISNTHIVVMARRESTVVLDRGASRVTYDCFANHCEATPQPGDGKEAFDTSSGQIAAHESAAKQAAGTQ